jgi:hypothetical protein
MGDAMKEFGAESGRGLRPFLQGLLSNHNNRDQFNDAGKSVLSTPASLAARSRSSSRREEALITALFPDDLSLLTSAATHNGILERAVSTREATAVGGVSEAVQASANSRLHFEPGLNTDVL